MVRGGISVLYRRIFQGKDPLLIPSSSLYLSCEPFIIGMKPRSVTHKQVGGRKLRIAGKIHMQFSESRFISRRRYMGQVNFTVP